MRCFLPQNHQNTICQLSLGLCSTNCGRPLCFIALVKDLLQSFSGCFLSLRSLLHFIMIPAHDITMKKYLNSFKLCLLLLYKSNLLGALAQKRPYVSISFFNYFNSLDCLTNTHYLQWQAHIWTHTLCTVTGGATELRQIN